MRNLIYNNLFKEMVETENLGDKWSGSHSTLKLVSLTKAFSSMEEVIKL